MGRFIVALVRGYQILISPLIGPHCRFHPSCSHYTIEAIEQHGIGKGSLLAIRRISKCHPWHPGGYDPVPSPTKTPDPEDSDG